MIGQPYYGNQMMQPGYMAPPPMMPPPPMQGPNIIVIQNKPSATITNMAQIGNLSHCPYCDQQTNNLFNRKAGCITFAWCICLLMITTGLFWIPFCCDGCKDTDVVCQRCCNKKTSIQANCC